MSKTISFPTEEKITEWLEENGYDGFYNEDGDCGCHIGDIAPCGETINITSGGCTAARIGFNGLLPVRDYLVYPIEKENENE